MIAHLFNFVLGFRDFKNFQCYDHECHASSSAMLTEARVPGCRKTNRKDYILPILISKLCDIHSLKVRTNRYNSCLNNVVVLWYKFTKAMVNSKLYWSDCHIVIHASACYVITTRYNILQGVLYLISHNVCFFWQHSSSLHDLPSVAPEHSLILKSTWYYSMCEDRKT